MYSTNLFLGSFVPNNCSEACGRGESVLSEAEKPELALGAVGPNWKCFLGEGRLR